MSVFYMIITGFCVFVIQWSIFPFLCSATWQPDLWLTLLILSALMYDKKEILIWSIFGGFIQDIISGSMIGTHLLLYTIIAFLFFKFVRQKFNRRWYISSLAVMIGTFIYTILLGLLITISGENFSLPMYIAFKSVPLMLSNSVSALFMYNLLWNMTVEGESQW
ncbi:MAG: rod shape-determining protein MreD [Dialister pneumosintes]